MQTALSSTVTGSRDQDTYNNLALIQACKLLDLLVTLAPDDFQLHEWLYITDTIDAVYRPSGWGPIALVDQVAESLTGDSIPNLDQSQSLYPVPSSSGTTSGLTALPGLNRPFFATMSIDGADMKAMARESFVKSVLHPFFSQLSMHAYEATYGMGLPDIETCRVALLDDVLDESTII